MERVGAREQRELVGLLAGDPLLHKLAVRVVDAHLDGAEELLALVDPAGELLELVGVVGQRPLGVVGPRRSEPHAGRGVPGALGRLVVGVGRGGVRVPRGRGARVPVGVGHDDVGLPGGRAGDAERHARHAGEVAVGDLHELEVAALDLVGHRALPGELDHLAVLLDGERDLGVGAEVSLGRLRLAHEVVAVGQGVGRGLRGTAPGLERERYLPERDLLPAHERGLRGRVHDLEDRAGAPSRSRAKGSGRSGWPRTRP